MRITRMAATGVASVLAAAALGIGAAGAAGAATSSAPGTCTGTGPASTLSVEQHDAFLKEMTALKAERDAIMAKYGKAAPKAGKGQATAQRARGTARGSGAALTAAQRTAMQKELAAWRVERDALFEKYGLTAPNQGRSA